MGIKDSSGDLAFMMRMIAAVRPLRPDFSFPDRVGGRARADADDRLRRRHQRHQQRGAGSDAAAFTNSARAGNYEEAMKWQYRILELFDVMLYPFEFPEGSAPPPSCAASIRPWTAAADRRAAIGPRGADVRSAVHPGGFRVGGPPASGLRAAHPARPAQDKVEQVVFEVMQELEKRGVL